LRTARNLALQFLEGMNDGNESNDQAYIENSIKRIMKEQEQSTAEMSKYVMNMENEQKNLEEKLKKKAAEL
jgi:clusterin-associated protein 1